MNKPRRIPDLEELRDVHSEVLRLFSFIESPIWVAKFAKVREFLMQGQAVEFEAGELSAMVYDKNGRYADAHIGQFRFFTKRLEGGSALKDEYEIAITREADAIVDAKRKNGTDAKTWGKAKPKYMTALGKIKKFREAVKSYKEDTR